MTDHTDRLAKMQDEFDGAEAKTSGGGVPDGDYQGRIERFDFWEKEGGGPLKLITEISVQDGGEFDGLSAPSVWHELEDPDRIAWTKGYLETLGLQGVNLAELPKALEPIAGTVLVSIRVVTTEKGDKKYRNTYVNEVVGHAEADAAKTEEPEADGDPGPEEDIPF